MSEKASPPPERKVVMGGIVLPGTSLANLTGSWRSYRPVFLQKACTGCAMCSTVCPEGCVFPVEEKRFNSDANYCKGCGICAEECPVNDIEMILEER